jgi:PII-like signaling protein
MLANSLPMVLQSLVTRSVFQRAAGAWKEPVMLTSGKAVKVSIYLSDGAKHHGVPVYTSLLDYLFHNGVYGATVLKGVAGFGSTHRIHAAHILEISDHLPIKIEFIETREKVDALLPELEKRSGCGIIEIQETSVIIPAKK